MINIAIVDDEEIAFKQLEDYLLRFSKENGVSFNIQWYADTLEFLEEYNGVDIVFMDVEMPHFNGMCAAEKLREIDANVPLIFVTNMVKYAIRGYSVRAIDYILKPVNYVRLSTLLQDILRSLNISKGVDIWLKTSDGAKKIPTASLMYIAIKEHLIVYYTTTEQIQAWGSLAKAQKDLPDNFVRCNHSHVVNLEYITSVTGDIINVADGKAYISISHGKRKEFMSKLNRYMGIK